MTTKAIPSLSGLGWVTDPARIMDKVLSFYILTDKAQSTVYKDKLISLPYTYHLYINDPVGMAHRVQQEVTSMLSTYFGVVEVTSSATISETSKEAAINIYAAAIDDKGVRYSLGKVLKMSTDGVKKVVNYSNYGDANKILSEGF